MNTAYLLIGGNMGNRSAYLAQAISLMEASCGSIVQCSSVYETAAWGVTDQPSFYNQAIQLTTFMEPELLMQTLLEIEETMGRKRMVRMGPRIIDLDLLLMNNLVWQSPQLTLPHPALPDRRFALLPLAEIAAELVHPILHKTIAELLAECSDTLDVQKK